MRTQQWSLTISDTSEPMLSYSVVAQAWLNPWDRKADAIILSTVSREDLWKVADEFAAWLLDAIPDRPSPEQPVLPSRCAHVGAPAGLAPG
jgi:hypothetical protein